MQKKVLTIAVFFLAGTLLMPLSAPGLRTTPISMTTLSPRLLIASALPDAMLWAGMVERNGGYSALRPGNNKPHILTMTEKDVLNHFYQIGGADFECERKAGYWPVASPKCNIFSICTVVVFVNKYNRISMAHFVVDTPNPSDDVNSWVDKWPLYPAAGHELRSAFSERDIFSPSTKAVIINGHYQSPFARRIRQYLLERGMAAGQVYIAPVPTERESKSVGVYVSPTSKRLEILFNENKQFSEQSSYGALGYDVSNSFARGTYYALGSPMNVSGDKIPGGDANRSPQPLFDDVFAGLNGTVITDKTGEEYEIEFYERERANLRRLRDDMFAGYGNFYLTENGTVLFVNDIDIEFENIGLATALLRQVVMLLPAGFLSKQVVAHPDSYAYLMKLYEKQGVDGRSRLFSYEPKKNKVGHFYYNAGLQRQQVDVQIARDGTLIFILKAWKAVSPQNDGSVSQSNALASSNERLLDESI